MFSEGRAMGYNESQFQQELKRKISESIGEDMDGLLDKYIVSLETIDELQAELDSIKLINRLAKERKTNPFTRIVDFFNSLVFQIPIVRK
jgi:hypothetical protein